MVGMRRDRRPERARVGPAADRHSAALAARLGKGLRDARQAARLTQAEAAARAGLSQGGWSKLETQGDGRYTLATWDRAAFAVGGRLNAYVEGASAADQPRDAVHLRNQELIIRTAKDGGWRALPEEPLDRDVGRSRWGDVLLHRRRPGDADEYALLEVIDWFDDVGAPTRAWQRRLDAVERYAIARMVDDQTLPRVSGCWVVRATRRNRQLIGEHRNFFQTRFPGSGRAWITALTQSATPMPAGSALLWVSVRGERMFPVRLG